jgi:Centromere DNA-binding protein complex CBF3 subunit, domain 2
MALWMYYRFHVMNEPWPDFSDRDVWYFTKLLSKINDNPRKEITAVAHRQACNAAYSKANCEFLKGTHEGRREGCKLADMLDVPDAQMRRLGRWDSSSMTQYYSSGLPKQGARILAGHGPDKGIIQYLLIYFELILLRSLFPKSRMS